MSYISKLEEVVVGKTFFIVTDINISKVIITKIVDYTGDGMMKYEFKNDSDKIQFCGWNESLWDDDLERLIERESIVTELSYAYTKLAENCTVRIKKLKRQQKQEMEDQESYIKESRKLRKKGL
jgi:hypothetical protein